MHQKRNIPRRPAFTLIEMLVVIGIIVVLIGLLFPMLNKARRAGQRSRIAADISSIGAGLELYHQDFGDYPRLPIDPVTGQSVKGVGFAVLGEALVGPGPAIFAPEVRVIPQSLYHAGTVSFAAAPTTAAPTLVAIRDTTTGPIANGTDWGPIAYADGADGPGFRVGPNIVTNSSGTLVAGGKTYGPYLNADKFKMHGLAILDIFGNPILYFPASPQKINLNIPFNSAANPTYYVASRSALSLGPNVPVMYNFDDNGAFAITVTEAPDLSHTVARMQVMLGDMNQDGGINLTQGEHPATNAPYLLWSCGPDGHFGPVEDVSIWAAQTDWGAARKAVNNCDDVTNFSFGQ